MNDYNCKYLACFKSSEQQQDLCPECFKVWQRLGWLGPLVDLSIENHDYSPSRRILLWSLVIDLMLEVES